MTTLSDIVSKRLTELGRGPTQAEGIGKLGKNFITDILAGKKTDIRAQNMNRLAKALDWDEEELLAEMQRGGMHIQGSVLMRAKAPPDDDPRGLPLSEIAAMGQMPVNVPVYGVAAASAVGSFVIDGQIDVVKRPPGLTNAKNVYALYVHGESMSPRHRSGDLIFISPDRPPRFGDDVVIQTRTHSGAPIQSWVKEFDHANEDKVVVRQLNPDGMIEFKRATVVAIHRVLTMRELFGA